MTDQEIDRLLSTPIPGGSQARDWFLPHDTERGLANVRDVVRRIVAADRELLAKAFDRQDVPFYGSAIAESLRRSNAELRGASQLAGAASRSNAGLGAED